MNDWSVSLPKKIVKQIEKEVISQNINLQTAVLEALELWLNTPISNSRKIKEVGQEEIDEVKISVLKQCFFVDRDCVTENCQAWINDHCSILRSLAPEKFVIKHNVSEFCDDKFVIPDEGFDLNEFLDNIERQILRQAMIKTNGFKKEAAKILNISFDSLRHRLDKLDIEVDRHITENR